MDNDLLWKDDSRETLSDLEIRIQQMIDYIQSRKETNIAIIGHSSFLGQFKDNHIGYLENGESELKHCHPYEFILPSDYKRPE